MPANGNSRANENKRIRQEALREQLSNQKLVEKVLDNIKKMDKLDPVNDDDTVIKLNILKTSNEQRLKLINKYLPDLKAVEIEGDVELSGGLTITWQK